MREAEIGLRTRIDKSNDPPLESCSGMYGPCSNSGRWVRQNTAYIEDEKNWVFLCEECEKLNDEYWYDMWSEI